MHYLSREGSFLRRVHELVAAPLTGRADPPAARHLEVSRRSTFGASIERLDRVSLALMWSQYADQSPRSLFESLGVPIEPLAAAIAEAGLGLDDVVEGVANDDRVAALIERSDVRSQVEAVLAERRRALVVYLRQEMDLGTKDTVVVDVGWRGTIQDNLARAPAGSHAARRLPRALPVPQPAAPERHEARGRVRRQ